MIGNVFFIILVACWKMTVFSPVGLILPLQIQSTCQHRSTATCQMTWYDYVLPSLHLFTFKPLKFMSFKNYVQFDSRISRASEFVEKLKAEAGSDSIRNPDLANLEIERRKIIFGKGSYDKLMEDIILFFSRYCYTI